jgi:RHS repeat-associated protein
MAYQHQTNTVLTESCGTTCMYLSFRYDAKGRVTRDWNRFEGQTSYVHDDALNQVTVTHPSNGSGTRTTIYRFDELGRVASVTDPMSNVTSYEYDALDRVKKITLPRPSIGSALNFTTTYLYDQAGANSSLVYTHVTDANQRVLKQGYDQFGQLVESIDATNHKTAYGYGNGLLSTITDANGNVTSYEYDAMRHLKKITFPDGLSESYTHHTDGLLASKTDRAGLTTTYGYDAFGRVVSETTGSQSRTFTYDGAKLASILDNYSGVQETNSFTYDPKTFLPLTDTQGRRYQPATGTETRRGMITYTWESSMDRIATYSVTDGDSNRRPPITSYSYHADGSVNTMEWEHVPDGYFDFTYNRNGDLLEIVYPNGQQRSYTVDNQGRVLSVSNNLGSISLASFTYEYDKNQDTNAFDQLGRRTRVTARVPAWSNDNVTSRYSYDANQQLVKARVTAGTTTTETEWGYDGIGNRISRTMFGSTANYNYVKNSGGGNTAKLASFGSSTATHDVNGNVTRFGITAAWDARGRMSKMQDAFNFHYDAFDRRAAVDYLSTKYIYKGDMPVAISYKQNNGYYLADYVFAPGIDQPLARGDYFGVTYYSVDALGSVVVLSDPDGTVRNHYRYSAWGDMEEEGGPIVQPFTYTGREVAVLNYSQRAVYYYRARWMIPGHGRFMSEDPYRSAAFTPYAYVGNQPLQYIDPSGAVAVNKNKTHHSEDWDTVVQHCNGYVKGCAKFSMSTNCSCAPACDIKTKKLVYKANISITANLAVHVANDHGFTPEADIHKHEYDHIAAYEKIIDHATKQGKNVEAQNYPSMAVCKIGCFGFGANWKNYGFIIGLGESLDDLF